MKANNPSHSVTSRILTWLPVMMLMILAAYLRFWTNSGLNYLLLGGDGPYYPLQVRSMMENQRLAFPDMPLVFIIEGMFAAVLNFFHAASYNDCIIMATKLADAFVPPLAAIPVFLILKEMTGSLKKAWFPNYLVLTFSVINLTTLAPFSSGLHKNAVAVVWMFLFFLFMIKLITYQQRKYFYYLLPVLILCALTHFGCFALLLFFSGLTGFFRVLYYRKSLNMISSRRVLMILSVLVVSLVIIASFDQGRFARLIHIPLKLFEFPVFLLMLRGYDISMFLSPMHMLTMIPLSLTGMLVLIVNRKKIATDKKVLAWALACGALLLASPLIGLEWANRLHIMAYVPITVLYLILFNELTSKLAKAAPLTLFLMLMGVCVLNIRQNQGCITNEAYDEFVQIRNHVAFTEHSVILGRQDLRILGSWEFRTKTGVDYLFTKKDFKTYDAVYVIRQIKGSNFSAGRARGDADIPENSVKVYAGTCFELYRLINSDGWKDGTGKPPRASGRILTVKPGQVIIINDKTGFLRTIEIPNTTTLDLMDHNLQLEPGMYIEISGNWKAFSLNVVAESIRQIPKRE